MPANSPTLAQRFVLEAVKSLRGEAVEAVLREAYNGGETARTEAEEVNSYYQLSDRANTWSAIALRKVELGDYANVLDQQRALSADGAAASEQTLRTARSIPDEEPAVVAADPIFLRGSRAVLLEAQKAIQVAATFRYGSDDAQALHRGTAAASRAFVAAAQGFTQGPEEARRTVEAMRGNASSTPS
jgi:hypothetical protein